MARMAVMVVMAVVAVMALVCLPACLDPALFCLPACLDPALFVDFAREWEIGMKMRVMMFAAQVLSLLALLVQKYNTDT